jgi:4-hydroxythreonine-4-phosphate dehydrogenase
MNSHTSRTSKSILAVTLGDPAGVGPELCVQLLARKELPPDCVPLIVGDYEILSRVAKKLNVPLNAPRLDAVPQTLDQPAVYDPSGALSDKNIEIGKNQASCGHAAARYISEALRGCMEGRFAAMVTAPISKKALNMAGVNYPGHTEMLADLTHTQNYAMLLYSKEIACAFVTCHQALSTVADSLSVERIVDVANLGANTIGTLREKDSPRMCLLGLNPHAGEEGLFGDEEQTILIPAKKKIEDRGIAVEGPLPPDTAFTPQARARYDGYIAMYHDQGSIPFKMLAFDTGVNITMGLPIIRTSPDHGTAFDIAWQGKVRPDSFFSAFDMAARLSTPYRQGTKRFV